MGSLFGFVGMPTRCGAGTFGLRQLLHARTSRSESLFLGVPNSRIRENASAASNWGVGTRLRLFAKKWPRPCSKCREVPRYYGWRSVVVFGKYASFVEAHGTVAGCFCVSGVSTKTTRLLCCPVSNIYSYTNFYYIESRRSEPSSDPFDRNIRNTETELGGLGQAWPGEV